MNFDQLPEPFRLGIAAILACICHYWYLKLLPKLVAMFPKKVKSKKNSFDVQYRVYLKMSNGAERTTGVINVTIPANDTVDMEGQLKKYVVENIQLKILSIR